MKTAGEILKRLFDEGFYQKAKDASDLFGSWADITEKNGLASAGDHSRIKELEKGILLIEVDHPGWKQILQTKQGKFLHDFRYRFPEMNISGIALKLSSEPQNVTENATREQIRPAEKNEEKVVNNIAPVSVNID